MDGRTQSKDSACRAAAWVRATRTGWRSLTGGPEAPDTIRATLVALSGGADSAAIAIALATLQGPRIVLAQVIHDQRPAEVVHDDRNSALQLARRLGVRFVAEHVTSPAGNCEHAARLARYAALDRIAAEHGCSFIATGHHAHDQAETIIMAMCRGGSPEALLGIRCSRPSETDGIAIIRPALALSPDGARDVCRGFGYAPRVDATNSDPARTRARVRAEVIPALGRMVPDLGGMLAATTARLDARLRELSADERADVGFESIET